VHYDLYTLFDALKFDKWYKTVLDLDVAPNLFFIQFLFRRNHDYRSRVTQFVEEYRKVHHFQSTTKCIAFHIRRGDRVIDGRNMIEHCEYIRNYCLNFTGESSFKAPFSGEMFHCMQMKFDYYGFGCHTPVPFGALTFDNYMKAAEMINNATAGSVKTILVMTNDHDWSVNQSKSYAKDWTIHVTPQPPNFRGSSVMHGIINQGSIELTQQCDSLIGHYGSAFTNVIFQYMCVRHGTIDDFKFRKCPTRFDFSEIYTSM
jgi:hypothetical protein